MDLNFFFDLYYWDFFCGSTFCEVIGEFLLKTDSKVDFFYNSEAIMLKKYCCMWLKSNSEYNMKRRVVLWDGTNMLILNWELFLLFNLVLGEAEALTVLGLGQQALARGLHNLIISTGKLSSRHVASTTWLSSCQNLHNLIYYSSKLSSCLKIWWLLKMRLELQQIATVTNYQVANSKQQRKMGVILAYIGT